MQEKLSQEITTTEDFTNRNLRIVLVTVADLPEGGGRTSRLKSMVQALTLNGHSVLVLNEHALGSCPTSIQQTTGMIGGARYEYVLGKVKHSYGFSAAVDKLKAVAAIGKRIKKLPVEPDILWFNCLSFYDMYPLTRLAQRKRIATIQSYEDERLEIVSRERLGAAPRLFGINSRLSDRWCPQMADAIVTISHYLTDKYSNLSGRREKVHLVPTIIDCDIWNCGPEPLESVPTILYTGVLSEQDEIENVLTALSMLRNQGQRFRFVMLGGGSARAAEREERIKVQIASLNLTDVVESRGFVPLDQVRAEIQKANVLINIRRESIWSRSGLSTKLSEYLASGRLVLGSNVGEAAKYVKHGESALLVSQECSVEEIATMLGIALSSPDLRGRIGKAGRDVALQHFDLPVAQAKLRHVLTNAIQHPVN
jgi:glycosyltransferase involved in cell wall biosynthesis